MSLQLSKRGRSALYRSLWRDLGRDLNGGAVAEFALVLPVLALLLFTVIKFGIVFNQYIELANGVAAGGRLLAVSRGSFTSYSDTLTAINNAAPNLHSFSTPLAGQTVTVNVAGTACTAANQAGSCANAFTSGGSATLTATYPVTVDVLWVSFGTFNISSSSTEFIQ